MTVVDAPAIRGMLPAITHVAKTTTTLSVLLLSAFARYARVNELRADLIEITILYLPRKESAISIIANSWSRLLPNMFLPCSFRDRAINVLGLVFDDCCHQLLLHDYYA